MKSSNPAGFNPPHGPGTPEPVWTARQNADGSWSPAKPLRPSWWVRLERWINQRQAKK